MVETPSSSAEYISTSWEAIKWTETNPNSKLNQIKWILEKSYNPSIKNLMKLIVNKDYKKLQKEIWCAILDGKLWTESLKYIKKYTEIQAIEDAEKKETENELQDKKQETEKLLNAIAITNEGKDKFSLKEENWQIKIDRRTISFKWLFLLDKNWNEEKIAKINNFYVKRNNDWLEIYSNEEPLPRFKLNNNWIIEWRSNPNDNKFDINLNWYWTIFDSLRVELANNYDKYKTPEKKMDFVWRGFEIKRWDKMFSINAWNIYISWLKLYNSQSKKWENMQNITNIYVKRDSENNLIVYSSGEKNPKIILKPDGTVKWVLPDNWDNLNYGTDTALRRMIWNELNSKYDSYRHEDVVSTSEPVLITYTTREEPTYVSEPIMANGRWDNPVYFDEDSIEGDGPVAADRRWNTPRQSESLESILSNIDWKNISLDLKKVPILDENAVRTVEDCVAHRITDLHISRVWKKWKRIYINNNIFLEPAENWWLLFAQDIDWTYNRFEITHLMYWYKWKELYNKLNKEHFS